MSIKVNIKKKFEDFELNIAFEGDSKRIGILGASGCGKSMTLKSIAGIISPDEGYIEIDGRILFSKNSSPAGKEDKMTGKVNLKPQERNIGYLFQNYALFPTMTVEKNIEAGLKGTKDEKKKRVREMIRKFELQGLEKRYPKQLSGGQQQRVALARIMAYEPDVILLDEPFSAMDVFLKDRLQQEMKEMLSDYQGIVIMVSHSRDEIYRFSRELLVMEEGHLAAYGKTKDIFRNPGNQAVARLTGCKNITPVERLDEHHAYLPEWDVNLAIPKVIPEGTKYLGYRAHFLDPVWKEPEDKTNLMHVRTVSMAELPFECNYYLKPVGKEDVDTISWFVQKENLDQIQLKGMPEYLMLLEEYMMFLS